MKIINQNLKMKEYNMNVGIFDPDGINPNPFNGNPYSQEYKALSKMWANLPAYKDAKKILKTINNNEVILIQSETGTGKSVICPKIALHSLNYVGNVIMTLPKKDITKSSATFSAKTMDSDIGEYIGYQFRGEQVKSDKTKILYSTDGSIISMIKKDPLMLNTDIIIIDEAHERKIQIDLLLYLIKHAIKERKKQKLKPLKLIIMSATIDKKLFETYYKSFDFSYLYLSGATNYEIKDIYLENSILSKKKAYVDEGIETIKNIVKNINNKKTKEGDILFFVCSVMECLTISEKLSQDLKDCFVMALYSGYPKEENIYVTNPEEIKTLNKNYKRRIFISTNIAESSLTIPNIIYVVDNGMEINMSYNSDKSVYELKTSLITKAQIQQRRGRTGRTQEGFCYHLYTKKEYSDLEHYPAPEIKKIKLTDICLTFFGIEHLNDPNVKSDKVLKIFKKLIEPPLEKYILTGFENLQKYGIIDKEKLTNIGLLINETNIEINNGLCLLYAYGYGKDMFNTVLLIISVCANLKKGITDLFYEDISNSTKNKIINNNKSNKDSYFLLIHNLMKYINGNEQSDTFNPIKLREIKKFYTKYKYSLRDIYIKHNINVKVVQHDNLEKNILECFHYGFKYNIATKKGNTFYYNKMQCDLSRDLFKYANVEEIMFYTTFYNDGKLKLVFTSV